MTARHYTLTNSAFKIRAGRPLPEVSRCAFFLSLAVLPLLYAPASAQALDAAQIKAMFFNGKPFVATSTTRQRFTMVFTPDGKATREPIKKAGEPTERPKAPGKWSRKASAPPGRPARRAPAIASCRTPVSTIAGR